LERALQDERSANQPAAHITEQPGNIEEIRE